MLGVALTCRRRGGGVEGAGQAQAGGAGTPVEQLATPELFTRPSANVGDAQDVALLARVQERHCPACLRGPRLHRVPRPAGVRVEG